MSPPEAGPDLRTTPSANTESDIIAEATQQLESQDTPVPITMAAERDHPSDDPATAAASEELKHTTLSDRAIPASESHAAHASTAENVDEDKHMEGTHKDTTPDAEPTDAQNEELRERLSSPKKKRGRDQEDETECSDDSKLDEGSADGATANEGREKKRHRDISEDHSKSITPSDIAQEAKESATMDSQNSHETTAAPPKEETSNAPPESVPNPTFGSGLGSQQPQTSASAFASSGFGALAASATSPFGTIGASKPSVFGTIAQSGTSGFGAIARAKSPPLSSFASMSSDKPASTFGGGIGGGASTSGFGGALGQKSVFGTALSNGFGGAGAPKLTSFAGGKENAPLASKPAKPFGAPESDEEESSEDDGGSEGEGADEEEGERGDPEDKKKSKIPKAPVDDGEAGEATLLQLRGKLYTLESKETGWKERGVGTLKVNVNKSCVEMGENGQPIPDSLDFSTMDDNENVPAARLIMRQENTHRVILNTIIVQAMGFQQKPSSATAVQILFTAFEGEKESKPANMLLKLSESNARLFMSEIKAIQYGLKDLP